MKRLAAALFCFLFITISAPVAQASNTITLTEPTSHQIDGKFIDDGLVTSLSVTGRLGKLVFSPPRGLRTWVVDPALIEEIVAISKNFMMTNGAIGSGQIFAQTWLTQFQNISSGDTIQAMAYGNPSQYWINRFSPHNTNYILSVSQTMLETLLNHPVLPSTSYRNQSHFWLPASEINSISIAANNFNDISAYMDPKKIDVFRLGLVRLLNPGLIATRRSYLIKDLSNTADGQLHLIHLSSGKFTVTSVHQSIPITLTNDFPNPAKINLSVFPTNAKIEVSASNQEIIPANSKIQVLIPVTVLTSGSSGIAVEITTPTGKILGDPVIFPIKLTVISPVATWITTGAAILVFFAATIQSVRRIRKRRA